MVTNFYQQKEETGTHEGKGNGAHQYAGPPIEMVLISSGSFKMGSKKGDKSERPIHLVKISTFLIGKYEVTQGQWRAVMGNNPSNSQKGEDYPVEQVSWNDVQEFIRKLNAMTGGKYRLPTEAEWEYACRAGTTGEHYGDVDFTAWYDRNSDFTTHPVGKKVPNDFRLFDMMGNVWEWCQDWYDDNYYSKSPESNPGGPVSGGLHVYRGGCFGFDAEYLRSAHRHGGMPEYRYLDLGFRLAKDE